MKSHKTHEHKWVESLLLCEMMNEDDEAIQTGHLHGLVSLQTPDVDRGTWTWIAKSQEHRLSLWLRHSEPNPSVAKRLRRPFYAGPQLLLSQAVRPCESWGPAAGESPHSAYVATGWENTASLPNNFFIHIINTHSHETDENVMNKVCEKKCCVLESYWYKPALLLTVGESVITLTLHCPAEELGEQPKGSMFNCESQQHRSVVVDSACQSLDCE